MTVLASHARPGSPEFERNEAEHRRLAAELRERIERVAAGGESGPRASRGARQAAATRARRAALRPRGSLPRALAACREDLYDGDAPGAGIITGVGRAGREVVVVANDATVKGGTYYPVTVKKHLRAQEVALTTAFRASTWSTRRRVPAAPGRGLPRPRALRRIFFNQATMAARGSSRRGARLLHGGAPTCPR